MRYFAAQHEHSETSTSYSVEICAINDDLDYKYFKIKVWMYERPFSTEFTLSVGADYQRGEHTDDDIGYYVQHMRWKRNVGDAERDRKAFMDSLTAEQQTFFEETRKLMAVMSEKFPDDSPKWTMGDYSDGSKYMQYSVNGRSKGVARIDLDFICEILDTVEPKLREWKW